MEVKFLLYIHIKTSPSICTLFFSFLLFTITQYIWPSSRWLHYFTLVFICKYIILNTLINILIMTKIKARYAQKYFPNCLGYNISSVVPYIFFTDMWFVYLFVIFKALELSLHGNLKANFLCEYLSWNRNHIFDICIPKNYLPQNGIFITIFRHCSSQWTDFYWEKFNLSRVTLTTW